MADPSSARASNLRDRDSEHQLDRDTLKLATTSVIDAITSPAFIERMREFRGRAARGEVELGQAAELLSIDALKEAGAQLPDDFRLSSRTFEDLEEEDILIKLRDLRRSRPIDDDLGIFDPKKWNACAGAGAGTVCGCAGGGT